MEVDVGGNRTWLRGATGDATMHVRGGGETKAAVGNFTMGCVRGYEQREQVVFDNRKAFDNSLESEREILSGDSRRLPASS